MGITMGIVGMHSYSNSYNNRLGLAGLAILAVEADCKGVVFEHVVLDRKAVVQEQIFVTLIACGVPSAERA